MNGSRRPADVASILVAGFALAMLLPIAATPYLGDDIFNSYINGTIGYGHTSFWEFFTALNANWIRQGRFFPGAFIESYGLFHVVTSLAVYKALQVLITLANVFTFFVLMREFRVPRALSLLGVVVLLCTFQMRAYHDGLLGFSGNIEFITELALLSTLSLLLYVRRGNRWALYGSLAAYAIGLITYEVTYLLCLVFFAVLLVELPWRRAVRLAAPYFVLSATVVFIQLYVKSTAHMQLDADYSVGLNVSAFLAALAKQTLAAIPFTYVVIDPSSLFARGETVFRVVPVGITAAIGALAFVAAWTASVLVDAAAIDRRAVRSLVAVGVLLWLTPAVLVAASARYQHELTLGLGHVPVYIEYFGVSMLVVAAFSYAVMRWGAPPWPARLLVATGLGLAAAVMYASNMTVISASVSEMQGISNMNAALASGILSDVPDGSDLFVDLTIMANRYTDGSAADAKYYYYFKTGKHLTVHYAGKLPEIAHCARECRLPQTSYELINVPVGDYAGFDALGHVSAIARSHGEIRTFASEVTLVVRGAPSNVPLTVQFTEHGCKPADRPASQTLLPQPHGIEMVRLASTCGSIEMNTLAISELVATR